MKINLGYQLFEFKFLNGISQAEFVSDGPEIAAMKPVYKDEDSSLTLHCMVQSEPPASIVWLHPTKGQVSNKRELEIGRLSRSDAGQYICTANVKYYDSVRESASQSVNVFVNCKLRGHLIHVFFILM